jgi:glycerophosphoryl diester phosphodiesterase
LLTRLSEIFPHHRLKKCHADFIIPHYKIARLWRYIRFISPKRNMVVWTVNEKKEMLKLFENKAAGIITDYSNIALKVRDDWKSKSV